LIRERAFVADLHLHPGAPGLTACFLELIGTRLAPGTELYVLGDLFDAWIGDDDDTPAYREVVAGLAAATARGLDVRIQRGNRDFLIGTRFARETGCRLLADEEVIELGGKRTLLLHGDTLCTGDRAYQSLRRQLRDPAWQRHFLALPLAERRRRAAGLRAASTEATRDKPEDVMDASPAAVRSAFETHRVERIIHGHTHRPACHRGEGPGGGEERRVLPDWRRSGHVLRWGAEGPRSEEIPPPPG